MDRLFENVVHNQFRLIKEYDSWPDHPADWMGAMGNEESRELKIGKELLNLVKDKGTKENPEKVALCFKVEKLAQELIKMHSGK